ncbi:MAG: Ig-like domain-containing protein, partial [Pseudomonadota bacterium]
PVDAAAGDGNAFASITVDVVPADGQLIYNNGGGDTPVTDGQIVTAADIASGFLRFVPVVGENNTSTPGGSYTSFTFFVSDDGGTGNGGVDTDPVANTLTFSVTPVNDAPVAVDDSYTVTEDAIAPLVGNLITDATGGVADSDVDGDPLTVSAFTIAGEAGPFVVGAPYTITGVDGDRAH